jgi:alkylation response protein AidB-like acyl-CoA dehydrogenase
MDWRAGLSRLLPDMRGRASDLDRACGFPWADLESLRRCGVLTATLPRELGGLDLGADLFDLLRLVGRGNLAVGRLVEGHYNALRLIARYGTREQLARAAADAAEGHLFGIWNTEAAPGVQVADGALSGRKINCSAAGAATRAVITVGGSDESRMLLVRLKPGERAGAMPGRLQGMRATQAGWIDFELYRPHDEDWIGQPGDYMREPEFSAGAWRTLSVLVGGIEDLSATLRTQLRARGRDGAPLQADRIAQSLIAEQTALLWARECARLVQTDADAADMTGYVNLARRAVEMAGITVIELAQRSLGLGAFIEGNPAERLLRDLATYLRQPAMDEALGEAAAHFVARPLPNVGEHRA